MREATIPQFYAKPLMQPRFILIHTSHAGNVGATARAMKVMGFDELVLVAPRWANVLRREETIQRASGALDVLDKTRVVDTLDEALDGVTHLCATAMTPRDFGPPTRAPRDHFSTLAPQGQKVGFLFGSERFGMTNEDVCRPRHLRRMHRLSPGCWSIGSLHSWRSVFWIRRHPRS
jgi:tRNA/rRNA methyltransferase